MAPGHPFAASRGTILKPSAIDLPRIGWKLLVEPLLQEFTLGLVPVPLDEIHLDVVQTLLGQLGLLLFLSPRLDGVLQTLLGQLGLLLGELGLDPLLGLGIDRVLLASLGIVAGLDRRTPLPDNAGNADEADHHHGRAQSGDHRPPSHPLHRPLRRAHRPRHDRLARQESIQFLDQRPRRRIPPTWLLLQAFQADRLQVPRHGPLSWRTGTGSWPTTCKSVSIGVAAWNGGRPVSRQ